VRLRCRTGQHRTDARSPPGPTYLRGSEKHTLKSLCACCAPPFPTPPHMRTLLMSQQKSWLQRNAGMTTNRLLRRSGGVCANNANLNVLCTTTNH
jgi:hypothetical protein